ncbi:hypothetical protein GS501_09295 [Saccharibacter sp. 17.LH.SD]|uniref:hypothetical protein n=1 Tax=Saccharibacter sp. 17.LH.SD TaxID=2689393 RepID=UPI00136E6686|nr:hypothetical protein [Saccharibacter sp. 17.LH.SD]MXV45226.1 hypothetical protein [Saccharibacter sp. 17.LH.SD]
MTIKILRISDDEKMVIHDTIMQYGKVSNSVKKAREYALLLKDRIPVVMHDLNLLKECSISCLQLKNLPAVDYRQDLDGSESETMALVIGSLYSIPFQYIQQNHGKVAAEIRPSVGREITQSSSGKALFGWHTDDAFLTPEVRTDWIQLLGCHNQSHSSNYFLRLKIY